MKLIVEFGSQLVLIDPTLSSALLEALGNAKLYQSTGYGRDKKYEPQEGDITVTSVPDDRFLPTPDPIKTLQGEKELSDKRWFEYYNKASTLENQLKALQADLDNRGITYTKEEVKA